MILFASPGLRLSRSSKMVAVSALLAAPLLAGCSSDDSAPASAADAATSDGPVTQPDAAPDGAAQTLDGAPALEDAAAGRDAGPREGEGEDAAPSDGGCARPINGVLVNPSGSANVTLTAPANATTTAPGTIPCAGTYDPASGTANGPGKTSGRFTFECIGHAGTAYYGFRISALAKPEAGQSFPVGTTGSVPGDGGYYPNGQSEIDYEEGDSCHSKTSYARTWDSRVNGRANPVTGSLVVDTVTGQTVTFHFEATGVPASAGTLASGPLGVSATAGTVVVSGL